MPGVQVRPADDSQPPGVARGSVFGPSFPGGGHDDRHEPPPSTSIGPVASLQGAGSQEVATGSLPGQRGSVHIAGYARFANIADVMLKKAKDKTRSNKEQLVNFQKSNRKVLVKDKKSLQKLLLKIWRSPLVKRAIMVLNVAIIFGSNLIMVLETCDGPNYYDEANRSLSDYPELFTSEQYDQLEIFFTVVFTTEVLFRLARFRSFNAYISNFHNVVDWISILPLYLQLIFKASGSYGEDPTNENTLMRNTVTLLRIFRVLKVGRHFADMEVLVDALFLSFKPLIIPMVFFAVVALIFSVALFMLNPCMDKDECSHSFTDVFNALYFVIVTMLTVGYGDIVPGAENFLARFVAGVAMVFGSLYLAMPLAVIGNNFEAAWKKHIRKLQRQRVKAVSERLVAGTADISELKLEEDVIIRIGNNRLLETYFDLSYYLGRLEETIRTVPEKKIDSNQSSAMMQDIKAAINKELSTCISSHEALMRDAKITLGPLPEDIFCNLVRLMRFAKISTSKYKIILERRKAAANQSKKKKKLRRSSTVLVMKMNEKQQKRLPEKIYLALELPQSSPFAMMLSRVLLFVNIMSVIVFFAQTMPELQKLGPQSPLCKEVVQSYCQEQTRADRGCYTTDNQPLKFACSLNEITPDCYEGESNFGTRITKLRPDCEKMFHTPSGRYICDRPQCNYKHEPMYDASGYWQPLEIFFTTIFTLELILRAYGSPTWKNFFHVYNCVDLLSLSPSYYQFIASAITGNRPFRAITHLLPIGVPIIYEISSSGLSWNAGMKLLKFSRVVRLLRRFSDWEILSRTFSVISGRLFIPVTFLSIFIFIGGYVEFQLEQGHDCFYYAENPLCFDRATNLTANLTALLTAAGVEMVEGRRYLINMFGNPSLIKDVAIGSWFSAFTMTTTGYGDVYPVTRFGRLFAVIMMIGGSAWNSMPLSLVGGEFYSIYSEKESQRRLQEMRKNRKSLWLDNKNTRLWNQYAETLTLLQTMVALVEEIPDQNKAKGGGPKKKATKVEPEELNDPDTVFLKEEILKKLHHVQLLHMKIIKIMAIAKQEGIVSDL